MKIAIASTGFVRPINAMLLAQHNEEVAIDIVADKVALLNAKQSPIVVADIEDFLHKSRSISGPLSTSKTLTPVPTPSSSPPHPHRLRPGQ